MKPFPSWNFTLGDIFFERSFCLVLSLCVCVCVCIYKVYIYTYIDHLNVYLLAEKKIEWQNATALNIAGTGRMSITKASASHHLLAHGYYSSSGII